MNTSTKPNSLSSTVLPSMALALALTLGSGSLVAAENSQPAAPEQAAENNQTAPDNSAEIQVVKPATIHPEMPMTNEARHRRLMKIVQERLALSPNEEIRVLGTQAQQDFSSTLDMVLQRLGEKPTASEWHITELATRLLASEIASETSSKPANMQFTTRVDFATTLARISPLWPYTKQDIPTTIPPKPALQSPENSK